ncbi:hypothetical protein Sta7437_2185 [Stanieria cyanosphaera PCC 7437]|uniref:Uncharacterized protein n=1 Tax=Stanieria cyanosphaera (strain ATCC 29371 / PCC 7437) TaxID=111780 RepID=K9XUJ5_STAC7|nr:hypothetical protein [Stanieria cyanosphaera]AFZ35734.1 hypothetical protein Sta7437_2185 [Stanieria cyanosphaera PCC 7437]
MNNSLSFIIKVAIASTLLSVLIKYGGSQLSLTPTVSLSLIIVCLPSVILALIMGWRIIYSHQS